MDSYSRKFVGYYLKPFRWIGGIPSDDNGVTIIGKKAVETVFDEQILTNEFDIRVEVSRDGLFLFEFHKFRLFDGKKKKDNTQIIEDTPIDPNSQRLILPITRILNAHLALLWLSVSSFAPAGNISDYAFSQYSNSSTDLWLVSFSEDKSSGFTRGGKNDFDNGLMSNRLDIIDRKYRINSADNDEIDRRFSGFLSLRNTWKPIPLKAVKFSFENLKAILFHKDIEKLIVLIELLAKSLDALAKYDYDWTIMIAWAGIESALADWWVDFIKSNNKKKDVKQSTRTVLVQGMDEFIDSDRKARLLDDTNTYNAAVRLEILSWADELDTKSYKALVKVRQCRNAWIHKLKHSSREDAETAISALIGMLKHVYDLELI